MRSNNVHRKTLIPIEKKRKENSVIGVRLKIEDYLRLSKFFEILHVFCHDRKLNVSWLHNVTLEKLAVRDQAPPGLLSPLCPVCKC